SIARRAAGSSCAARTHPAGTGRRAAISLPRCSSSNAVIESPDFRTPGAAFFFHERLQLVEAARDPARHGAGGKTERVGDHAVAPGLAVGTVAIGRAQL